MTTNNACSTNLTVRIATTEVERNEIFRLRYTVYVEEMGIDATDADHDRKMITDKWDESATLLYVTDGKSIVGTLRRNLCSNTAVPNYLREALELDRFVEGFDGHRLSISSKFVVATAWRSSPAAALLISKAYSLARELSIQFDFHHCAPSLISMYEQMGFRRYAGNFTHEDVGLQIPMVLVIEDVSHLRAVRSPFYRVVRAQENDPSAADWFEKSFPEQATFMNRQRLSHDEFYQYLSEVLRNPIQFAVQLFSGLDLQAVRRVLKTASVHRLEPGQIVIRPEDRQSDFFIVLKGFVTEIEPHANMQRGYGPSEMFGQLASVFGSPSKCLATAVVETEVLIVPRSILDKERSISPDVVKLILLNLFRLFRERKYGRSFSG